jgi:hypothetical protein
MAPGMQKAAPRPSGAVEGPTMNETYSVVAVVAGGACDQDAMRRLRQFGCLPEMVRQHGLTAVVSAQQASSPYRAVGSLLRALENAQVPFTYITIGEPDDALADCIRDAGRSLVAGAHGEQLRPVPKSRLNR